MFIVLISSAVGYKREEKGVLHGLKAAGNYLVWPANRCIDLQNILPQFCAFDTVLWHSEHIPTRQRSFEKESNFLTQWFPAHYWLSLLKWTGEGFVNAFLTVINCQRVLIKSRQERIQRWHPSGEDWWTHFNTRLGMPVNYISSLISCYCQQARIKDTMRNEMSLQVIKWANVGLR